MNKFYKALSLSTLLLGTPVNASLEPPTEFDIAPYTSYAKLQEGTLMTEKIQTEGGKVSILRTAVFKPELATVVFIHINSGCKEVFLKQFEGLAGRANLIALDLLGHGQSDNAAKPQEQYTFNQYGSSVAQVLAALEVKKVIIAGASLGGHVAMQMMVNQPELVEGVFMTGSPAIPLGHDGFVKGFKQFKGMELMGHAEQFTPEQAKFFWEIGGVLDPCDALIKAGVRAHGLARSYMQANSFQGIGISDQEQILQTTQIPVGIVIGENDEGINNEFVLATSAKVKRLLSFAMLKTGHATFWQDPEGYNKALLTFIDEVKKK
jgi:pimeloyl-ACP methyl ester carboxylesterase